MSNLKPLAPEELYQAVDPAGFDFENTADLEDLTTVIGQERAVESIRFGITIRQKGYNLFALGPKGVGKQTALTRFIEQDAAARPVPDDWCYVYDFEQPHRPNAIQLPAGRGVQFAKDIDQLREDLQAAIPAAFQSEDYQNQRQALEEEIQQQQEEMLNSLQNQAKEKEIALIQTPSGLAFAPIAEGEVISPKQFLSLPEEEQKEIQGEIEHLQGELQRIMRQVPQWRKEGRRRLKELNESVAGFTIAPLFEELMEAYEGVLEVAEYLADMRQFTIDHIERFLVDNDDQQQANPLAAMMGQMRPPRPDDQFHEYEVNLLVDNSETKGAPVVFCDLPTHQNLTGRVEHLSQMGALLTNFTLIKPGALHKANGGYLILDARKLLTQPYAWEGLKRALQSGEIAIESLGQVYSIVSTISLEPEAIPLEVKIVLHGEPRLYYLLYELDPDFGELFKVMADFDMRTDREADVIDHLAAHIATRVRADDLRHFDRTAVARVIEQATRQVSDKEKVSVHMESLNDLIRESAYWAGQDGQDVVTAAHVQQAIDAHEYRSGRIPKALQESILRETIFIDTSGEQVGQINGLAVLGIGGTIFGKPNRITARIRMGKGDVVDIERQTEMGGPIHSKGVMILTSFFTGRFALERPLSLSASLVFEQSYGGVDGDSASSTELYALLSALADAPIRQGLAVTGSVNQLGQVQPIGGVNEKVEGYFDICRERGLTGDQGVLIPTANVKHLMLRDDVRAAVAAGKFAIYAVDHVDQGIELLTGIPAGALDDEGNYPEASINGRVVARLEEIIERQRKYSKGKDEEYDEEEGATATEEVADLPPPDVSERA
jgi:lon-related putative ATP-dependent protease